MKYRNYLALSAKTVTLAVAALVALTAAAVSIPTKPLVTQIKTPPMVMLIASKDHKLFVEAYNDASDLDGDGKLDLRFKSSITYYGLFESTLCYTHNGVDKKDDGVFTPVSKASTGNKCTNSWSGNWLNYVTTSRIDSLRKVLYGGYRSKDSNTETWLRRAYIPQDAHSWAKEYTSEAVDDYKISDYTPLSQPTKDKRHFFGNLTANATTNCKNPDTCSNLSPLLSVVKNSNLRVWDWASKAAPVLDGNHGGTREDYTVQIKVCTTSFHDNCKQYGSVDEPVYKPVGLLHDYGENDAMLFGLLTGSYNKNMSGGVLRKKVSSFKDEVESTTGIFKSDATIVNTFNRLRIRDFNNNRTDYAYRNSSLRTRTMSEGEYVDWGNPVAEMMYEGLRYFAGKAKPTSDFDTFSSHDEALGLPRVATWNDPYTGADDSKTRDLRCARSNMLVMSDVYPSYDADQIPGSPFTDPKKFTGDISKLNAGELLTKISNIDKDIKGLRFVGQSSIEPDNLDYAPSAKTVTSLSTVRGLAPEEPSKQGSYNAAAIAYFGKVNDVSSATDEQNVNSFMLALSSTLPKFEIPIKGKTIQIVPFAKTINGLSADRTKGKYQPTDQIVDLYVTKYDLTDDTKEIKEIAFKINYEADEQGNDYDMDIIAEYTIKANTNGTVTVQVEVTNRTTGSNQNVGYTITGTNRDGIYLVAQDTTTALDYFLNVPPGRDVNYCNSTANLALAECKTLPGLGSANPKSTQVFQPGKGDSGQFLQNPLWYAAKWGGFKDVNNNKQPDDGEWDTIKTGVPDNYFMVQNPIYLRDALKTALDNISDESSSASNVLANSTSFSDNTRVFQARFNADKWSGDLVAYEITSSGVVATPKWLAQDSMPAPADRSLFIHTTGGKTTEFKWDELPSADKALLDSDASSLDNSKDIVDYLRGVRNNEQKDSTGIFRQRVSLAPNVAPLGDIVHSSPFFDQENDVLYVNANDGMLHAFRASDVKDTAGVVVHKAGSEVFGFIPSEVVSRLKNLSNPAYTHEYLVDGDVAVSPKTAETGNRRLLFGALGRGGKGLFGLNVSTPTSFSSSDFLWEYTPTGDSSAISDGVLDTVNNAKTDNDLGYMLGRPVYAKMNNGVGKDGDGAVIVGNGYNSTSGKAVLYIFLLDNNGKVKTVKKLDTLVGGDNGLGAPTVVDVDSNGTADFIYAGDLKGNVWKFDVRDESTAYWLVGLSGKPLFVAKDADGKPQPITAPLAVVTNDVPGDAHIGKRFVFFGTGSYFRSGDPADTSVQTWYGLIDEDKTITDRSELRQRTIEATGVLDGKPVRAFSAAEPGDMLGQKGWYLDFTPPVGEPVGERMVTESAYYKLALPALVGSSIIPASGDPCIPGGTGYLNVISPFNGASMTLGILDVNDDKNFKNDLVSGLIIGSVDLGVGMPSRPTLVGSQLVVGGTNPKKPIASIRTNLGISPLKGRISWREIIID